MNYLTDNYSGLSDNTILIGLCAVIIIMIIFMFLRLSKIPEKRRQYWIVKFSVGFHDEKITFQCLAGDNSKEMADTTVNQYTFRMKCQAAKINEIHQISLDEYKLIRTRLLCLLSHKI